MSRTQSQKYSYEQIAALGKKIADEAKQKGIRIRFSEDRGVVTLEKEFDPAQTDPCSGDGGYVRAEYDCAHLIALFRQTRPGSTWGTTSDGVGGYAAQRSGLMVLNRSGISKRVANAVSRWMD